MWLLTVHPLPAVRSLLLLKCCIACLRCLVLCDLLHVGPFMPLGLLNHHVQATTTAFLPYWCWYHLLLPDNHCVTCGLKQPKSHYSPWLYHNMTVSKDHPHNGLSRTFSLSLHNATWYTHYVTDHMEANRNKERTVMSLWWHLQYCLCMHYVNTGMSYLFWGTAYSWYTEVILAGQWAAKVALAAAVVPLWETEIR